MIKHYFIEANKGKEGPFTFEELSTMKLLDSTKVWYEGINGWVDINDVAELKNFKVIENRNKKRIVWLAKKLNVPLHLFLKFLKTGGFSYENPNSILTDEAYLYVDKLFNISPNELLSLIVDFDKQKTEYEKEINNLKAGSEHNSHYLKRRIEDLACYWVRNFYEDITEKFTYKSIEFKIKRYIQHVTKHISSELDGYYVYLKDKEASEIRPYQLHDTIYDSKTLEVCLNEEYGIYMILRKMESTDNFFVTKEIVNILINRLYSSLSVYEIHSSFEKNKIKMELFKKYGSTIAEINSNYPTDYYVYDSRIEIEDDYYSDPYFDGGGGDEWSDPTEFYG